MSEPPSSSVPVERSYEDVLADAVQVLTEAARLTRPALVQAVTPFGDAGAPIGRDMSRQEPADFAEFVTLALAGAAANVGGVETALRGRPGSWEADGVRTLLTSTVGHDEATLLEHRTEPLVVRVFVDEILNDLGVWTQYNEAARALSRRAGEADLDSPEQDRLAQQEEQLEQERERAWAAYGEALRVHVEAGAAALPGLRVPVQVVVDLVTFRGPGEGDEMQMGVSEQLLQEAIEATPPPPSPGAPTTGV